MKLLFVLMLFGILLIAGCGQQQQQTKTDSGTLTNAPNNNMTAQNTGQNSTADLAPSLKEFKMLIQHTGYNPVKITVNKGDTVRILATTGAGQEWHKHSVTIDEYSINAVVQTTDTNNPVKIEFVADKSGTFRIYCGTCNDDDGWKGKTGSTHPDIQAMLEVK